MTLKKLFSGRINRINFFMGFLLSLVPGFLMILLFSINDALGWIGMAIYFTYLASLCMRRLHDTGQSSWWLLVGIPPFTEFLVIYLILAAGQPNANKYGESPAKTGLLSAILNRNADSQPTISDKNETQKNHPANTKRRKVLAFWILAGGVLLAGSILVIHYYSNQTDNPPQLSPELSAIKKVADQKSPIYYTDAPQHIGESVTVDGTVVKVYTSNKGTIFFDYCDNYRDCPFSAVIFANDAAKFDNPSQYEGTQIGVTGIIKSYQGRAEIILNDPNQIETGID